MSQSLVDDLLMLAACRGIHPYRRVKSVDSTIVHPLNKTMISPPPPPATATAPAAGSGWVLDPWV